MGSKHAAQRRSFLIWDAEIPSHHPKSTVVPREVARPLSSNWRWTRRMRSLL
jgi:hypothetical protein